jgi:hypothetical protein
MAWLLSPTILTSVMTNDFRRLSENAGATGSSCPQDWPLSCLASEKTIAVSVPGISGANGLYRITWKNPHPFRSICSLAIATKVVDDLP